MAASKNLDPGKWAESQAQKWLEEQSAKRKGFAYHRYPDARSAQGPLGPQPADYLIGIKDMPHEGKLAVHLEVKETAQTERLPKAKIRQYGMLKKFDWAGFLTLVLVYRSKLDDWVVLYRSDLFDYEEVPASFSLKNKPSYPNVHEALRGVLT